MKKINVHIIVLINYLIITFSRIIFNVILKSELSYINSMITIIFELIVLGVYIKESDYVLMPLRVKESITSIPVVVPLFLIIAINFFNTVSIELQLDVLLITISAVLFEEILFRDVVFLKLCENHSLIKASLISAFYFSITHINLLQITIDPLTAISSAIFPFGLAMILNATVYKSKSLLLCFITHGLNNYIIFLNSGVHGIRNIRLENIIVLLFISAVFSLWSIRYLKQNPV